MPKEKYQLNDDIYGNIMIAVTEAVNNAIKHGSRSDSSKNVSLSLSLSDSLIKFRVEDEGLVLTITTCQTPQQPKI